MSSHQWEKVKENAAPMARGRKVEALEKTVTLSADERLQAERMLQHFEDLVSSDGSNCTVEGDPLVDWLSYIKFHQETFPSATHEQFLLLERCFRTFIKHPQYANDGRYVRVCCLFADATQDSVTTFQEIYKLGIGHNSATFWNAWAFVAEKQQNFQLAEQIFEKAIRKEAQPLQFLLLRQKRFQRRMSRHFLNLTQNEGIADEDDLDDFQQQPRGALGSLREDAVVRNDRRTAGSTSSGLVGRRSAFPSSSVSTFTDRSSLARARNRSDTQNENTNEMGTSSFPIFEDTSDRRGFLDDSIDQSSARTDREREQDRWKENRLASERWNERGSLANTSAYGNHNRHQHRARATTPTAFCIHVDEACAAEHDRQEEERRRYANHQRFARDERAVLREHSDTASESLSHDPFFFVRNPQQIEPVVAAAHETDKSKQKKKLKGIPNTIWKHRLLKGADGNEQCFEEARWRTEYFKTIVFDASNSFNNLAPPQSDPNNSSMSVSMDELTTAEEESFVSKQDEGSTAKSFARRNESNLKRIGRADHLPPLSDLKRPLSTSFLRNNTSFENPTPRNISTASSTVDEAVAVGAPTGKEEQTINTQLALRELSVMFSSPAVGLNESNAPADRSGCFGPCLNESCSSGLCNTSLVGGGTFETIAEVETSDSNGSFAQQEAENEFATASLDAGSQQGKALSTTGDFEVYVDKDVGSFAQQEAENEFATASLDAGSQQGKALSTTGDFEVYVDKDVGPSFAQPSATAANGGSTFRIYEDQGTDFTPCAPSSFTIRTEQDKGAKSTSSNKEMLTIFSGKDSSKMCDGEEAAENNTPVSAGDTACFSDIFGQGSNEEDRLFEPQNREAEGSDQSPGQDSYASKGDTATFSSFQVMKITTETEEVALTEGTSEHSVDTLTPTFGSQLVNFKSPKFGDISHISSLAEGTTVTMQLQKARAIDYNALHKQDVECAKDCIKERASGCLPREPSLSKILSTKQLVCDLPTQVLPRPLKKKDLLQTGDHLKMGLSSAIVQKELGRGAYGIVVSLQKSDDESGSPSSIAVKAQSPVGCLAWEYEVLRRVEQRIMESSTTIDSLPFPNPLSFIVLADGAMLGMATGGSGRNLFDLAHAYAKVGKDVPEVVALHYTSRMLHHLELLHWHAKVLHCDTKPDNWVLNETTHRADLMLVDFGRAIDLNSATKGASTLMDTLFTGAASTEEMMCVSMRQRLPWSFDVDTYGICASAHVLLFGAQLEIAKSTSESSKHKRWMPKRDFPRHWEKEIWTELFDSLLNVDTDFGVAIGSRPYSLKRQRTRIEAYLADPDASLRLKIALEHQSAIIASSVAS